MKTLQSLSLFFLCFTMACTKDRTPEFNEASFELIGKWNAYGYTDLGGYVPIEVIEIIHENGGYAAYKLIGDNAVRAGEYTWRGKIINFDGNPNPVTFHAFNGIHYYPTDMELIVKSPNVLVSEKWMQLTYVRRVE